MRVRLNCVLIVQFDFLYHYGPNHMTLGLAYIKQGRKDEGLAEMKKSYDLDPSLTALARLAYATAVAGRSHEANRMLKDLTAIYKRRGMLARDVAIVYVGLGEKEKAFEWLEKDFMSRSSELAAIISMQEFDALRGEPRYADLRKRMGLQG